MFAEVKYLRLTKKPAISCGLFCCGNHIRENSLMTLAVFHGVSVVVLLVHPAGGDMGVNLGR